MPFFYFEPKVLAHVRKDLNRHARACRGHPRLECRFKGSISLRTIFPKGQRVAEREGFEPPIRLPVCRISSAVHSTTLPPLHRSYAACGRGALFSQGFAATQGGERSFQQSNRRCRVSAAHVLTTQVDNARPQ